MLKTVREVSCFKKSVVVNKILSSRRLQLHDEMMSECYHHQVCPKRRLSTQTNIRQEKRGDIERAQNGNFEEGLALVVYLLSSQTFGLGGIVQERIQKDLFYTFKLLMAKSSPSIKQLGLSKFWDDDRAPLLLLYNTKENLGSECYTIGFK